jgi:hypothetical protein
MYIILKLKTCLDYVGAVITIFTVAYYGCYCCCYVISEVTQAAYILGDEAVIMYDDPKLCRISHLRSLCVRFLVITDYE